MQMQTAAIAPEVLISSIVVSADVYGDRCINVREAIRIAGLLGMLPPSARSTLLHTGEISTFETYNPGGVEGLKKLVRAKLVELDLDTPIARERARERQGIAQLEQAPTLYRLTASGKIVYHVLINPEEGIKAAIESARMDKTDLSTDEMRAITALLPSDLKSKLLEIGELDKLEKHFNLLSEPIICRLEGTKLADDKCTIFDGHVETITIKLTEEGHRAYVILTAPKSRQLEEFLRQ